MDQTFIAGVGNIYAIEACYYAGVRPTRRVFTLTNKEISRLYTAVKFVLTRAIQKKGSSPNSFIDAYGEPGRYVPSLKIYSRSGELCFRCKSLIKSISMGARGTTYCPTCQK